jgi:DinB superfamily
MPPTTTSALLLGSLDEVWGRLRRRLEGLTDEEYCWEPVPGCWTVRPVGGGRYQPDWAEPEPTPPPVTTIAWRLCHLGADCLASFADRFFGDGSLTRDAVRWPGGAAAGVELVAGGLAAWRAGVASLPAERLWDTLGTVAGPYSEAAYAELILHVEDELIHHGAEVALLRDLDRAGR